MLCPTCGNDNRPGARFCNRCGAVLPGVPAPPPAPPPSPEVPSHQRPPEDLHQAVFRDLESGKSQKEIVKQLTRQGWSKEAAQQFVGNVAWELDEYFKSPAGRAALARKYRGRMIRGLLWTIAGIVVTAVTYSMAAESGGTYIICWGAVLFGIIDFLVGLVGWLRYRTW